MLVDLSDRLHFDAPGDVLNLQGVRFIGDRYRYNGKIISKPDAMQRLEVFIDSQTEAMQVIAAKSDLSIADIEIEGAKILKRIAIAQTVLGAAGFEALTNADLGTAGAWLKTQYYSGKSEDGKPFGLRHLAKGWGAGDVSQAQLAARLRMFAKAPRQLYWKLGKTDNHCRTCIAQSKIKGRPIDQIPAPGCCPECYSSCKCSIVPA
jgi:hypothetical protein